MNEVFWFASNIIPARVIALGFVIMWLHNRWMDRELAPEREANALISAHEARSPQ